MSDCVIDYKVMGAVGWGGRVLHMHKSQNSPEWRFQYLEWLAMVLATGMWPSHTSLHASDKNNNKHFESLHNLFYLKKVFFGLIAFSNDHSHITHGFRQLVQNCDVTLAGAEWLFRCLDFHFLFLFVSPWRPAHLILWMKLATGLLSVNWSVWLRLALPLPLLSTHNERERQRYLKLNLLIRKYISVILT